MPPEQFTDLSVCDERSDIYSFGIVLYQMASGGRLPFSPDNPSLRWTALKHFHHEAPVPKLNSPLFPIILRCLEKEPRNRYQTFWELRTDIELILKQQTGQTIKLPEQQEIDWWEWGNKGISLHRLGFFDNAIQCYNKALEINVNDHRSWNNKGSCMRALGHFDNALVCFENALKISPSDTGALTNKGICLDSLGFFKDANRCFDDALKIDPRFGPAWVSKGCSLSNLERSEESIHCYDRAIEIEPTNTTAWYNKGMSFNRSEMFNEAVNCFNEVLNINPLHADSWYEKGLSFASLELYEKELYCFNKLLEIDPKYSAAWYLKANVEEMLGKNEEAISSYKHFIALPATQDKSKIEHAEQRLFELRKAELNALIEKGDRLCSNGYFKEAIKYYEKALIIDQHEGYAWYKKGIAFYKLSDYVKAIECYKNASGITPGNPSLWYNKALAEDELGLKNNAMYSFKKVIELAPAQYTEQIKYARQRLRELGER
jgi:tetratricopeptide (TPR) repeat protein